MKKQTIMTNIFGHVPAVARGWGILDKLSINHYECKMQSSGYDEWGSVTTRECSRGTCYNCGGCII